MLLAALKLQLLRDRIFLDARQILLLVRQLRPHRLEQPRRTGLTFDERRQLEALGGVHDEVRRQRERRRRARAQLGDLGAECRPHLKLDGKLRGEERGRVSVGRAGRALEDRRRRTGYAATRPEVDGRQ